MQTEAKSQKFAASVTVTVSVIAESQSQPHSQPQPQPQLQPQSQPQPQCELSQSLHSQQRLGHSLGQRLTQSRSQRSLDGHVKLDPTPEEGDEG